MQTGPCCCDLTLRGFTRTAQARAWRKRGEAMRRPWRLRARGRRKRAARTTLAVTSLARSTPSQNSGMPAGAAPPPGASPAPAAIASAGGSSSPFTILARVLYRGAARARARARGVSRGRACPHAACACSPRSYRRRLLALLCTGALLSQRRCGSSAVRRPGRIHATRHSVSRQRDQRCLQARRSCSASFAANASRLPAAALPAVAAVGTCKAPANIGRPPRLAPPTPRGGALDAKQRRNTTGPQ